MKKFMLSGLLILFLTATSFAATLTNAQLQALKTDITVTNAGELGALIPDYNAIAAAYAQPAAVACWVWRTKLNRDDLLYSTSPDGTNWAFEGNGFQGRSVPELMNFNVLFDNDSKAINPALTNIRAVFTSATGFMSGTGNAANNRTHFLAMARRLTNRGEKLFASGGSCSTATPSFLNTDGNITAANISTALALP